MIDAIGKTIMIFAGLFLIVGIGTALFMIIKELILYFYDRRRRK